MILRMDLTGKVVSEKGFMAALNFFHILTKHQKTLTNLYVLWENPETIYALGLFKVFFYYHELNGSVRHEK
jgi:hypothetical protein